MKKLFILFILASVFTTSCTKKVDIKPEPIVPVPIPQPKPIPVVEYTMPYLSSDKLKVKAELLKMTDKIVEIKHKNYYKVTCVPTKSETNMFSFLSYEYSLDGFDFVKLNFTYNLDESIKISKDNKKKLLDYLNNFILK
ncbi:MAG: hypothetical protein WBG43_01920 [Marinifilaceae bacterium]